MQGGAVTLARLYHQQENTPDVVLASDMMDLSIFRALTRHSTSHIPHALYFHENQLTYPQNSRQGHGWRYGFVNYASAMSADALFFNSAFHLQAFFDALPRMLKHFYDYNELATVDWLRQRAVVMALGLDLRQFDTYRMRASPQRSPLIVWNHRWEEDKNPALFLNTMERLAAQGFDFRVAIVGENPHHSAPRFEAARVRLGERVVQFGYVTSFDAYARLLWEADYVVSTAQQEFFGGAVAEAIYCGCVPIMPQCLNYPNLIPEAAYPACLYHGDDKLLPLIGHHLKGELAVDTAMLKRHIIQFDWEQMAPRYDDALRRLAQAPQ